jgi:RHS repeat-associated protein
MTAFTLRQGTSVLASLGYTRDKEGMVTSTTGAGLPGVTDALGYRPTDMLASDATGAYAYDAADNLTALPDGRKQRFDVGNQLCYVGTANTAGCGAPPTGATRFDYDTRGNRTARRPAGEVPTTYGYDQADRLTSASIPAAEALSRQYHALTAVRLADTSTGTGDCSPSPCALLNPATEAASKASVKVTGVAGVPTTGVDSVVLAIHSGGSSANGYLNAYPSGTTAPSTVSMFFTGGQATSNTVVAKVGADGRVTVKTYAASTHVVVEILGWNASAPAPGGLLFSSASPTRILSTNPAQGVCTPSPCARLAAGGSTTVQVSGQGPVPTGVAAVALMVHAITPDSAGYFAFSSPGVTPTPGSPGVPMTYGTGWTSDLVIVPVGPSGQVTIATSTGTDVLFDVVGWYTPPESGLGLTATAIAPETLARTEFGSGTCLPSPCSALAANTPKRIKVTGVGQVPANAEAVAMVLHLYYMPAASSGYLSAWKSDPADPAPVPQGADITWAGETGLSGTVIVPVDANGYITVMASTSAHMSVQAIGYYQAATKTYQYRYAPDGLRSTKTAPDGTLTRFTWDRSRSIPLLLAEAIDAPGGTANDKTIRYVYGPDGRAVADVTTPAVGAEVTRWYHHDQLGTTRALTDNTGAILATYAYTPYGEPAGQTGSATTPIAWAGEYRDVETGLTYLRARYYDPSTGQFLTRDPMEMNTREPYEYTGGNPVNMVDPTGLCGPFGDGGCPGGSLVPDEVSDAVGGAAKATGSYIYDHSEGLGQIAAGVAALGYASCPITAGLGCAVGGVASTASAGLFGLNAHRTCTSAGPLTAECGFALFDAGLAATGAFLPNKLALSGFTGPAAHFSAQQFWRSRALWNTGIGGLLSVFGGSIHTLLGGEDFFGMDC